MRWTAGITIIAVAIGIVVGLLTHDVVLAAIASAGFVALTSQGARFYRVVGGGPVRRAG